MKHEVACSSDSLAYDTSGNGTQTLIYLPNQLKKRFLYLFLKRLFDILLSALSICILFPLLIFIALIIKLDSKGPAIYTQMRAGKNGKPFKLYKFRSMCADAERQLNSLKEQNEKDGPIFKISNDPRVTKVGRVIRKTSIDELPQLFNILKGDMSIVGPRPPLMNEIEEYSPYQFQRLGVTPGLTCYWQISGRSTLSFDQWVELDLKYIKERRISVDLKIILLTVPAVLLGTGAY